MEGSRVQVQSQGIVSRESPADGRSGGRVVFVLAGGSGTRFGSEYPKQLVRVAGVPILGHTLNKVDSLGVDRVVCAVNESYREEIEAVVGAHLRCTPFDVVDGGSSRNSSVASCIASLPRRQFKVAIQDGVRPLSSVALFDEVFDALDHHRAVIPVVRSSDPLVEVSGDRVIRFSSRSKVLRGQSPQGFWSQDLFESLPVLLAKPSLSTVFEALERSLGGLDVGVVEGDVQNIKVTLPIDRTIFGQLLLELDTP